MAKPSGDSARIARADAGEETLYGAFIQLNRCAISGDVNAIPRRIPARPNAFDSVWKTTRLGYRVTAVQREELGDEKSIYASSITSTPFQNDRVFARKS